MGFIYFSYGMTKSASSFVYQLEEEIFKHSKYEVVKLPFEIRGNKAIENYMEPITDERIEKILNWLPSNAVTVIKTHGAPSQLACDLVNEGHAYASATYRDPRDIAISLLDHGQRSRETNIPDFANFLAPLDTLPELQHQVKRLNNWLDLSGCSAFSYNKIRSQPRDVVLEILQQTNLSNINVTEVLKPFEDKSNIIHYNVGAPGRFVSSMSDFERESFETAFSDFIYFCNK